MMSIVELDAKLAAMWKGSSDAIELTDVVDGTRTDLFERFERDPLARHDLEVQALVSGVRGSARIPRLVLSRVAGGGWLLTEIGSRRGDPPRIVSPRVFGDLRDAERFVFSLRLSLLAALGSEQGPLGSEQEKQETPNGFVVAPAPPRPLPWVKSVIGYPSEWSVAAGQSVGFHVSGALGGSYRASVHRLLGGGLAPSAPQLASEIVADLGVFPLLDQPARPGSYGIAPLTADLASGTLVVTFLQTRAAGEQALIAIGSPDDGSGSGSGSGDAVVLGLRDGVPFLNDVTASSAVPLDTWVTLVASWGDGAGTLSVLVGGGVKDGGSLGALWCSQRSAIFLLGAKTESGARFTSHFCGRIERPALLSGVIGVVRPPRWSGHRGLRSGRGRGALGALRED